LACRLAALSLLLPLTGIGGVAAQGGGIVDEAKIGLMAHDITLGGRHLETGDDISGEILFTSPSFLKIIGAPRPHLGGWVNTDGNTDAAYFGLTWGLPIFKHIIGHRYFLGLERGKQVSVPEAAASWYDNVYLPIVEVIRRHKVLDQLPGWTEADVYVEITRRWLELSKAGKPAGPHPAAHALLEDADAMKWWQRRRLIALPERRKSPR